MIKLNKEECYIALNDMYDCTLLNSHDCKTNRDMLSQLIQQHFKLVEEHKIIKQKYNHALEILEEKTVVPKRFWRKWL